MLGSAPGLLGAQAGDLFIGNLETMDWNFTLPALKTRPTTSEYLNITYTGLTVQIYRSPSCRAIYATMSARSKAASEGIERENSDRMRLD
jgi:hypothetical protein